MYDQRKNKNVEITIIMSVRYLLGPYDYYSYDICINYIFRTNFPVNLFEFSYTPESTIQTKGINNISNKNCKHVIICTSAVIINKITAGNKIFLTQTVKIFAQMWREQERMIEISFLEGWLNWLRQKEKRKRETEIERGSTEFKRGTSRWGITTHRHV